KDGGCWKLLGEAQYRAGDWRSAVAALQKSLELGLGEDAVSRFFLAMAQWKLGNHDDARRAYEQALQLQAKNQDSLKNNKAMVEDFHRFRKEAEEVLELTKK